MLGASGSVGRYVAAEIGRNADVTELRIASRRARTAEKVARLLGGPSDRVRPVTADITDRTSSLQAFGDADVVVSAAGPAYLLEEPSISIAVETGTPYVSLADDHAIVKSILALSDAAAKNGATIVSGCGLSPGLSNLLIALCAAELETIEEIDIAIAQSAVESEGEATAMHLLFELTQPAAAISEYGTSAERAGTAPRLVYFPEPVGWIETFRCGHPEIETLPTRFPGLRALQFRLGLTEKAAMDVARAATVTGVTRSEGARRVFLKASNPLRPIIGRMPPRGPAWTALRVDVRGQRESRPDTISFGAVDHLRNFVSVPMSLVASKLATGEINDPGVHTIDEVVRPGRFLAELGHRGVRVARLESVQA
jgi:saccharopine dehydrogenase-like NADP-dependent oxidoreductase